MMMPSIFGRDMFDDFFGYGANTVNELMKTDIQENEHGYVLTMNLPGIKKENVKAELKDGYLTIQAVSQTEDDEKNQGGKYIRRERFYGSSSRSFFVGKDVKQEDIKAKFENGTLKLLIPKKEEKPEVEDNRFITIEG